MSVPTARELILRSCPGEDVEQDLRDLIPGYQILACLGKGGMGAVYKAKQLGLDRLVALKLLSPDLEADPEYVTRFLLEARTAGKLRHFNIVSGLDCGAANGVHFMVMEFVEGMSLDALLKERGKLSERRALEIVKQVADGLEYAWSHRIIHRDIKPQNILILPDGTAKICDLGLCRSTRSQIHLTTTGLINCTPTHASPEQGRGDVELDCRTDIYSLGVTLYQLVTGVLPFRADAPGALLIMHATEKPQPPTDFTPQLSAGVVLLIQRMMEKDREKRPARPGDIAFDADAILRGTDAGPRPAPSRPPVEKPRTRRVIAPVSVPSNNRDRRVLAGIAAGLLVTIPIMALLLSRASTPFPAPEPVPTRSPAAVAPPRTEPDIKPTAPPPPERPPEPPTAASQKLDAFLRQIQDLYDEDFRRRVEILAMYDVALSMAGDRRDEVLRSKTDYQKRLDMMIRKAVEAARSARGRGAPPLEEYALYTRAARVSQGSSEESAMTARLERLKPDLGPIIAAETLRIEALVQPLIAAEKYNQAINLLSGELARYYSVPEWTSVVGSRRGELQNQCRKLYRELEKEALAARGRGAEATVTGIKARVLSWGVKAHSDALNKALQP